MVSLKRANPLNKMAKESRVSEGVVVPLWAEVFMFL